MKPFLIGVLSAWALHVFGGLMLGMLALHIATPSVLALTGCMSADSWRAASMSESKYWFPANCYGWGWGFPSMWQGWLVFGAFLALVAVGFVLFREFPPQEALIAFVIYVVVLSGVLVCICWFKGEPPTWRWR